MRSLECFAPVQDNDTDARPCEYNLERYRVVRRPPFKKGAVGAYSSAWAAQQWKHVDLCGQCSTWVMLICVASAAAGACSSVWQVQQLGHADLYGQCSSWSMLIRVASAAVGAC